MCQRFSNKETLYYKLVFFKPGEGNGVCVCLNPVRVWGRCPTFVLISNRFRAKHYSSNGKNGSTSRARGVVDSSIENWHSSRKRLYVGCNRSVIGQAKVSWLECPFVGDTEVGWEFYVEKSTLCTVQIFHLVPGPIRSKIYLIIHMVDLSYLTYDLFETDHYSVRPK